MTNADKIRAMSDEELAAMLDARFSACPDPDGECPDPNVYPAITCEDCLRKWLKQEAEA